MNDIIKTKGTVRLLACGGGGINVALQMERYRGSTASGFANLESTYVDTSLSNINKTLSGADTYLLPDMDGSGKVRSENAEAIASHIKAILQKHTPEDLTIVLSTFGGGSGSVIAPYLVSELLANNCPVIVCGIGSTASKLEAENTLKTIKSYEGIAMRRNAPVIVSYVQNGPNMPRSKADSSMIVTITSLLALFSRENRELDSQDLFNWLNYNRVTTFAPKVTSLQILSGDDALDTSVGHVISVATLVRDGYETPSYDFVPEYSAVGYLDEKADDTLAKNAPITFATIDGVMLKTATDLTQLLSQLERQAKSRVATASVLSTTDKADSSGIVL